jgi:hypothetical protein
VPAEPQPDEQAAGVADGLRDLGDAWQVGIDTAQLMAERVLALYRDLPASARVVSGDLDTELRRLRIDLERAVDLSMNVFDRVLTLVTRFDPATRQDQTGSAGDVVELDAPSGGRAATNLWVHNISATRRPAPSLRCDGLTSYAGDRVPARCVDFSASPLPIEARSSRSVLVTVEVPAGTPAAVYHGLILSSDDAEVAMPLRVRVTG